MFDRKKIDPPGVLIGKGVNFANPMDLIDIRVSDADRQRHLFVFGTTGVGKTRLAELLIEQDIRKGHSVVFFDPKGDQEIFTKIYDVALDCAREKEMMLVTPVYPEYSAVIDPLSHFFSDDELVDHVISAIPISKESFYRDNARQIAMAVIKGNNILAREEKRPPMMNLDLLRQSIDRESMEDMRASLLKVTDPEGRVLAGILGGLLNTPVDYYYKISMTLLTCLTHLSTGNVGELIGKANSNKFIDKLENNKPVILVVHTGSMLTGEAGVTLGKVLLSMIHKFVGRTYASDRRHANPALSIYIDEAQSLLFEGIEDMFAKVGSANVMMTAFAQSVNQIYAVVGQERGKSILDNTNTKIFMRCTDADTAEYVSAHFGDVNKLDAIFGTAQVTTREVEKKVVPAQDVLALQRQEFFLMTYSGLYRGKTTTTKPPGFFIKFPSAPRGGSQAFKKEESTNAN